MSTQKQIIATLEVKPKINAEEEIRNRIDFLKNFTKANGTLGFVLGISGGQDSSLAGRLAQIAVEELRREKYPASFTAVRLPYGTQTDEEDAQRALKFIRPDRNKTYNIQPVVDMSPLRFQ